MELSAAVPKFCLQIGCDICRCEREKNRLILERIEETGSEFVWKQMLNSDTNSNFSQVILDNLGKFLAHIVPAGRQQVQSKRLPFAAVLQQSVSVGIRQSGLCQQFTGVRRIVIGSGDACVIPGPVA